MKKTPIIVTLLLASHTLYGQQTPSETGALEEIVVEAMRIDKPLSRVPAAVSVVGQDQIQVGQQQLGLDESLARVPGLFLQNRYNFAQDLRVAIRGFGARSNFGIRGIKILVDGIPETLPDGQGQVDSIDLGAVEQIEVIRGPSSTLYGNASGGVISVTSESGPDEPFVEIRLSAGEYGFQKFQVKAGGKTEQVDYFVSLSDSEINGYREHSEAENTQFTGRLRFQLKGDADLLAVFNHSDQPVSNDPGGINATQAASHPRSARDRNLAYDTGEALEQTRLGLVYSKPVSTNGKLDIRSYFVWRDFQNKLPQFPVADGVDLERFFAGGGANYTKIGTFGGKPNRMIVGFDIDDQNDDRRRFRNNKGIRGNLRFDQNEHVSSYGIFIQDELGLRDNLELSFGLRYDQIEFDVEDHFLSDGDDSGKITLSDASPMIGLLFSTASTMNIYATISTSFETPTTTEFANPAGGGGFNLGLDPQ
ncbi:MAG: TonB-dependent receptor, partial [Gammaproteobacteria bacterium]